MVKDSVQLCFIIFKKLAIYLKNSFIILKNFSLMRLHFVSYIKKFLYAGGKKGIHNSWVWVHDMDVWILEVFKIGANI